MHFVSYGSNELLSVLHANELAYQYTKTQCIAHEQKVNLNLEIPFVTPIICIFLMLLSDIWSEFKPVRI